MIRVDGLSKHFGSLRAVDGVSFSVQPGEVVGLLGANGAGKTTTLRVLAGLLAPSAGSASIGGHDVVKEPLQARRALGFLTASTGLYERLTPREMLTTFGRLAGMDKKVLNERVESWAHRVELTQIIERRPTGLRYNIDASDFYVLGGSGFDFHDNFAGLVGGIGA